MNNQNVQQHGFSRTPPISAAASALDQQHPGDAPFSFRLPKAGAVDPFFGGARTFWNQNVLPSPTNGFKPPVKSIVRRQPGAKRGIRFILYESARAYFEGLAWEQCAESQSGSPKEAA